MADSLGGKITQISRSVIDALSGGMKFFTSGGAAATRSTNRSVPTEPSGATGAPPALMPVERREPWFGPGKPIQAMAPRQDVAGRAFDYPATFNIGRRPRQAAGISFADLKQLAEYDLVRMAIETRKDQMAKLEWSILPKISQSDELRKPADARCLEIQEFLQYPDKRLGWADWQRMLLEDALVCDAATIYVRPTLGGKPYSLEVVSGDTISPLLDVSGRMPLAPAPAFQQYLHGVPAINYTENELIYAPRNRRPSKVYGQSPVEQILLTVNIAIRRDLSKLGFYTEGNVPEALVSVPEAWTTDQILEFQTKFDMIMNDRNQMRRMKFVPGGMRFQPTRSDQALQDQYDEWLARLICYCFSLPNQPFVKMMSRASAETAYDTAIEEGLQPWMLWFKSILDRIIQIHFGYTDLEFEWDSIDEVDTAEQETRDLAMIQVGVKSIDEVRAGMGLAPIGMSHALWGIGPAGIMFVDELLKAKAAGLTAIQPPPPPQVIGPNGMPMPAPGGAPPGLGEPPMGAISGPAPGSPGAPMLGGTQPQPASPQQAPAGSPKLTLDQLVAEGIPLKLLEAVGLGGSGRGGRAMDVTEADEAESDPLRHSAAHPEVLRTLREAERKLGRRPL